MDLIGQIRRVVKNDSSFRVSVTRKIIVTGVVLFQERGMQALVLDILRLRWKLEMKVKSSRFHCLPCFAFNVMSL